MQYPLQLSFKIVALTPQIFVTDATGQAVCYVRQKLLKLRESVSVFTDSSKQKQLCQIDADRVIDFSASYHFTDMSGERFGAVRRHGMKSLFKAHYEILDEGTPQFTVTEDNALVKVLDATLGELPILGMFTGYFLHPAYTVKELDGTEVVRIKKEPAFFEGRFSIEKLVDLDEVTELRILMSLLMMALLERRRG